MLLLKTMPSRKPETPPDEGSHATKAIGASPTSAGSSTLAAMRLAEEFEKAMSQGILRLGEPMPKVRNLAIERRLSHTTVVAALKRLEEQELIHRLGRAYYVGPPPSRLKPKTGSLPPTLLLLSRRPEEWSEFHGNFLQPLAFRFASEADRFGVRLHPVLAYAPPHGEALFTAGKGAVADLVRKLGGAYLGTVVLTMRRHLPDHAEWLRLLEGFDKPVIWLQDDEPGRAFPKVSRLVRLTYAEWVDARGGQGEDRPTLLALKTLAEAGHRHIGYAASGTGLGRDDGVKNASESWVVERGQRLVRDAESLGLKIRVLCDFAAKPTFEALLAAWPRLMAHPSKVVRVLAAEATHSQDSHPSGSLSGRFTPQAFEAMPQEDREFFCEALALGPLLSGDASQGRLTKHPGDRHPPVTALVAPNDPMACRQFAALRRMGYAVPGDISLISFDNRPTLRPFPITSIDFGLDDLGYRAFHLLFGAVSIDTGSRVRQGHLRGTSRVVDQGSVGPPGLSRLLR